MHRHIPKRTAETLKSSFYGNITFHQNNTTNFALNFNKINYLGQYKRS